VKVSFARIIVIIVIIVIIIYLHEPQIAINMCKRIYIEGIAFI